MPADHLHHVSLTAPADVIEAVVNFYGELLDMRPGPRPDFGIAGYWLYAGNLPVLHLIEDNNRELGNASYFDHFALRCSNLHEVKAKLDEMKVDYGELAIGDLKQTQLFVKDPAGVSLELNFDISQ